MLKHFKVREWQLFINFFYLNISSVIIENMIKSNQCNILRNYHLQAKDEHSVIGTGLLYTHVHNGQTLLNISTNMAK